jgi:hypothetical protein
MVCLANPNNYGLAARSTNMPPSISGRWPASASTNSDCPLPDTGNANNLAGVDIEGQRIDDAHTLLIFGAEASEIEH